jgi:uncharacterized protein (DUF3084 family)
MDKNYISALEDTESSLNKKIITIEKYIKEFSSSNSSNQQIILSKIKSEFDSMKTDLKLMKTDIMSLTQNENKTLWQKKYSSFKSQKEQMENKINNLKFGSNSNNINIEEDYMNINKKVDLSKLSSEQVMKRGDKILDEDEKSLQNMIKTLNKGKDMIQETKKELYRQMEAMDRMEGDLNETDGSLNRTKKTINYMNKIA